MATQRKLKAVLLSITTFMVGMVGFYGFNVFLLVPERTAIHVNTSDVDQKIDTDDLTQQLSASDPLPITPCDGENSNNKYPRKEVATRSAGMINWRVECGVLPDYPADANTISKTVTVFVLVNGRGDVEKAAVMNGGTKFREAVLKAAYQTRFAPALLGGMPIKVRGVLIYQFEPTKGYILVRKPPKAAA